MLREKHGLTQAQLGEKIGLAESTISLYEASKRNPDLDTINLLADFFHVSIDYLFGRTNKPNAANPTEKIKAAIIDDPELLIFWNELSQRDDLQLMFKQVRDLSPQSIKRIIRLIKAVEDEEFHK